MPLRRIGIWIVGAKGGVATTSILGLIALKKELTETTGLVSHLPQFADLPFAQWNEFVIGGHEIRNVTLADAANLLQQDSRAIDESLVARCKSELAKIDANIRPGILNRVGSTIESLADEKLRKKKETPRAAIQRVQRDLNEFVKTHRLEHVIVVNLASTEPPVDPREIPNRWDALNTLLDKPRKCPLSASSLYAIAALDLGFPFVNFTPSLGSAPDAICELAELRETCHMGHDGKTGETLLKSALAPMFASRNLEVMSWVGHNIFGNMDGKVLDDPLNKKTKVVSKDRLLGQILGYDPQTHISIEYIRSLGDWKTAWDHIHFRGFLGTPMVMQFTWQGCDSLLAAPLVLDLVLFTDLAYRNGDRGLLTFLASFFKSPLQVEENDFIRQFQLLEEWARSRK